MRTRLACAALAVIAGVGCTDIDSATDLNPAGPPMIRQVRLYEKVVDSAMVERTSRVFAFGTHELAAPEEVHGVRTAMAVGNALRVIIDELLVGNNLEELQCRGAVDDDPDESASYGRVPVGADPDDVARCTAANDALPSTCPGTDPQSVCICRRPGGCLRQGELLQEGQPVGVLDQNQDGAADDMRFIGGAVGIQCGAIAVPISLSSSYWNPSGNQSRPPLGGFDSLGPAIVLVPGAPLPTSSTCGLIFADEVVDKQGIRVCTPPGGDIAADCTPGDASAFAFGVEPLVIRPSSFTDGATNTSRTAMLSFTSSAPVDPATVSAIQISPAPPAPPTIGLLAQGITITWIQPLAPLTEYTVTFPVAITDTYGQPLPQALSYRLTTGN